MTIDRQLKTDVLVIGGGGAGLRAALAAAGEGSRVLLITKGPIARSGITITAGGGIQFPFHPEDSPRQYFLDTINAGYGLSDQNLVKVLADDAVSRALDAERYGARFLRGDNGEYLVTQFPGQSHPRQFSFENGGLGLVSSLAKSCKQNDKISIIDDFFITGLLKSKLADGAAVTGAIGINLKTGELIQLNAKAVVMATGGCQWLWEVTDCPSDATGDGIIYAYRIGAELVDMEMVLFYPSVIIWPLSCKGAFVHYEYLAAGILDGNIYDDMGAMVLSKPLPMRDEAMRLMTSAISEGRGTANGGLAWYVGDSPRGAENVQKKLNTAQYNYIRANGYEPSRERIEVAPGAHYLMGGIHINEQCETTVQGLFATPECAGNIDGANRLGGNGLMATQVFGARAGLSAHRWACYNPRLEADAGCLEGEMARITVKLTSGNGAGTEITGLRKNLRSAVQKYAGVRRDRAGLKRLINAIDEVHTNLVQIKVPDIGVYNQPLIELLQLEGMCETASMIANCALLREESRGHHFRNDFPQQNDIKWLKHTSIIRGEQGPKYDTRPVVELQNF